MSLDSWDMVTLLVYLGGMAALGLYFSRRNTSTEEYFVGGRAFPGWAIGLSLVGTSISSITFLAFPGDAYKTAWVRFPQHAMLIPAVMFAAVAFLPFFRRGKITSAYEYLEDRYGPSIRVYGAVVFIAAQLIRVSLILYLLSLVLQQITGLDGVTCIVIGGVLVALYTVLGGIDAVIWTDVIQTVVLVAGGVVCLGVIVAALPGGWEDIFRIAAEHGKFAVAELNEQTGALRPVPWSPSLAEKTGTMLLLVGLSHFLTEYSSNQNVVQRYCASKSTKEARKAMFVCAFSSVPIWAFFMFLGTALFAYFQAFPAVEAQQILTGDGGRRAEEILPLFIMNNLPPGVAGLVIAAAAAAAMSSLDSSINAVSTVGVVDIYRRHFAPGRDDRHYLRVARLLATAAAAVMIGGAVVLIRVESKTLQDTSQILMSLLGGGLLGLYMLGFFTTRGDARAAGAGIVCTLLFTGWTVLVKCRPDWLPDWLPDFLHAPFDLYYTGLIGNAIMFAAGFFLGSLRPRDVAPASRR